MDVYPLKFTPIYKKKIWGGRNLERLFGRSLPDSSPIGESWELADLSEGVSIVDNGPQAGRTLTHMVKHMGRDLLGSAKPMADGRFPLLLKLLDANDILSLQVHPDAAAVKKIGGDAALKTECWYMLESRDGAIYKGIMPGTTPEQFREAIEADKAEQFTRRIDCATGDFHYIPAGMVHTLCAGLVVAEVQTASDTTYRVTDWGRGREIHVDKSMECIHFTPADDTSPGANGEVLLVTDFFTVARRTVEAGDVRALPQGRCSAIMLLGGAGAISHAGAVETDTPISAGDTVLLPAGLNDAKLTASAGASWLEITLPDE
ncbi:MAG: class I mannose-6-phosphate isomerase [Phycisphaerae bacterium]|nr:class I mannose-6-phosphate isomerase [Phycisphaerae bacterium]